jgi:hypothetical protein
MAPTSGSGVAGSDALRWGLTISTMLLILQRNPRTRKHLLIPVLLLESPGDVMTFIKGEYGSWVAFVGLTLLIFFRIPGDLDFPLGVYVFMALAPSQVVAMRGTIGGTVTSFMCVGLATYQYFNAIGGITNGFSGATLINTLAILTIFVGCATFFMLQAM